MNKAIEFVRKYGPRSLRIAVENAPSNAESYWDGYYFRENPQFEFNNGFHPVWNLTENEGNYFKQRGFDPIPINNLKQIVDAFELVDWHGGLKYAKSYFERNSKQYPDHYAGWGALEKAIELVEQCQ